VIYKATLENHGSQPPHWFHSQPPFQRSGPVEEDWRYWLRKALRGLSVTLEQTPIVRLDHEDQYQVPATGRLVDHTEVYKLKRALVPCIVNRHLPRCMMHTRFDRLCSALQSTPALTFYFAALAFCTRMGALCMLEESSLVNVLLTFVLFRGPGCIVVIRRRRNIIGTTGRCSGWESICWRRPLLPPLHVSVVLPLCVVLVLRTWTLRDSSPKQRRRSDEYRSLTDPR
jgi:hypothetical protein